jgi:hypothetical protein
LRLMLKDFTQLLNVRPFQEMSVISNAYLEMHDEWKRVQTRLGNIVSLSACGLFFELFGCMIGSLYTFDTSSDLNNKKNLKVLMFWWTPIMGAIQFSPLLFMILITTTGANKRAEKLKDQCTRLIASSLITSSPSYSDDEDDDDDDDGDENGQSRTIIPLFGAANEEGRSGGYNKKQGAALLPSHRQQHYYINDNNINNKNNQAENDEMMVYDEMELQRMKCGQEVMKLCDLIDRLPCELRLLGRAVSETDITYLCGFLLFVQFINLFGIAWAIPL